MFSSRTDASKVALAWLVARLRVGGFRLLDCQFMTDHLRSLGAVEISQKAYLELLTAALEAAALLLAPAGGRGDGGPLGRPRRAGGAAPDFGALDRLLAAAGVSGDAAAPGWVIAQLLGQTS